MRASDGGSSVISAAYSCSVCSGWYSSPMRRTAAVAPPSIHWSARVVASRVASATNSSCTPARNDA